MRLPTELERELRETMCAETFGRVAEILRRWTEDVGVTAIVTNLEIRHSSASAIRDRRVAAALRVLGDGIAHNADVVRMTTGPVVSHDAEETLLSALVVRQTPRGREGREVATPRPPPRTIVDWF